METVEVKANDVFDVEAAAKRIAHVVVKSSLRKHNRLSEKYSCELYLKREDEQLIRSYKIRGAFNKISSLNSDQLNKGIACASAGNHAQGVAYSCRSLGITGIIFMPSNTPVQKIERVKMFGGQNIQIVLHGVSYDESASAAKEYADEHSLIMIPPFDDKWIIEGQATVGLEILEQITNIDYLFVPVGGGGLAAGISHYYSSHSPQTKLIGVEPEKAASMTAAFKNGYPIKLDRIDPFVDGAAVQQVGELTYRICKESLLTITTAPEGKVCQTVLELYNMDGIVSEPAGALSIAILDDFADTIKGKKIVCILSGSNNDSNRMEEIKKLSDAWEGLQHYLCPCRVFHQ